MKKMLIVLAAFLATSCANLDRDSTVELTMLTESTWMMRAHTGTNSTQDDPTAEATRLRWLDELTRANGCKLPRVTSRVWTKSTGSLIQTGGSNAVGRLVYQGSCQRN